METAVVEQYEKEAAERTIEEAQRYLGLKNKEIAAVLEVNQRTVYRYKNKKNVPRQRVRARIEKLRELQYLLHENFEDEDTANTWVYSPVPLLKERRPIDLIRRGELDDIISVLAGMYSGSYA